MESKYVVLDWQQELYYEYLVFRKKSHGCAPSTEKTIKLADLGLINVGITTGNNRYFSITEDTCKKYSLENVRLSCFS